MLPRALACAGLALLVAACRSAGGHAPLQRDARELEAQPSTPPVGPQIAAEVGGRFAPGLEALQTAVAAGEDELARSLIAHLDSLGPDERVWNVTRAFERILDGRAAVQSLALSLVCIPEPLETLLPGAQAGAEPGTQAWRLVFRAENKSAEAIELSPGPATLITSRTDLGRRGAESTTQETRSFDRLKKFAIPPNGSSELELARFFLGPPENQLALRFSFELELRSGVLVRGGRELPAMHLVVKPARATRHSKDLPDETLTVEQLLAGSAGMTTAEELLALAVRTETDTGLEALETRLAGLPRTTLAIWIPVLRWIYGSEVPTDPEGARAWLQRRTEPRTDKTPRSKLVLPRDVRADEGGGH